jgi:cytochrome c oxidase cbb3-type subunit 3
MTWTRRVLMAGLFGLCGLCSGVLLTAQDAARTNPKTGDPAAIRDGSQLFLSRCAACHGSDAKGVRGPDLTVLSASGATDARLFQTIQRGIPNTEMPAISASDDDIWSILAYLTTLNTVTATVNPTGDAANGQRLFGAACIGCHHVSGRGGRLGPDLTRIGRKRSRAALAAKIRDPSGYFVTGYEPVTLVTRDGTRIRGAKRNEDTFSIQVMDTSGRLQGYLRSNLREVISEKTSLMPGSDPSKLSDRDLDDLLRYLETLR